MGARKRSRSARKNHFEFVPGDARTPGADRGRRFVDITGKRFGKLKVVSLAGKQGKQYKWLCKCDCGNEILQFGNLLRASKREHSRHCGCQSKQPIRLYGVRATDRTLSAWRKMIASGVRVCRRWRESFGAFRDDMGEPPARTTLARKDMSKGFSESNCHWQRVGFGRDGARIEFNGESLTAGEWAKRLGVSRQRIYQRLSKFPVELALSYAKCRNCKDSPNCRTKPRNGKPGRPRKHPEIARLSRAERAERRNQMRSLHANGMPVGKIALWFGMTLQTVEKSIAEVRS